MLGRFAHRFILSASIVSSIAGNAWAQVPPTVPDVGQKNLRDQERFDTFILPTQPQGEPLRLAPEEKSSAPEDNKTIVLVRQFRLTGVTKFPVEELLPLLDEWKGRELSLSQLRQAAARITAYYREHGYLVSRAYIPAQEIHDGIVEIAVLEGKVGKILLNNTSWVSDERILNILESVRSGDAVSEPELGFKLQLINELPGVDAAVAGLQPGESVGLSDISVIAQPSPFITGSVSADSNGNRFTGLYNLGIRTTLSSPLHLGDELSLSAQNSDLGTRNTSWGYKVPIGSRGLVLGAMFSDIHYQLGEELAQLQANGDTSIRAIGGTYPLMRTPAVKLDATLFGNEYKIQDRLNAFGITTNTLVRSNALGLAGSFRAQNFAVYSFRATYTSGLVDLQSADKRDTDAASAQTQGSYGKTSYTVTALLPLTNSWSTYAEINGQFASKNLDPVEKFSLGGVNGVRSYPGGEASGDEGYVARAELRYRLPAVSWLSALPGQFGVLGFVDHGEIKVNRNPFSQTDNTRGLSAFGFGANWEAPGDFLIKASLAHRLGSTESTDSKHGTSHFWLQGVKYF